MTHETKSESVLMFFWSVVIFLGCVCVSSCQVEAQEGNNAICTTQTGCGSTAPSPAFIDASVIANRLQVDICATLNRIFNGSNNLPPYPSAGEVIDTRGISGSALTCSSSPWGSGTGYINVPSTILLPAGTISISTMWVLPSGTKLIGEGTTTATNSSGAEQTTIQACGSQSCFSGTAMIQFGSVPQCSGISVENLTLNGSNQTLIGIQNS